MGVWIRSATTTTDLAEARASIPFAITTPLTLTKFTADLPSPQPPDTMITFTATATGRTPPYQYKWWVYDGASWSLLQDWSANNTFAWTPTTPNPAYQVKVGIRSATTTTDLAEAKASIRFVIPPGLGKRRLPR